MEQKTELMANSQYVYQGKPRASIQEKAYAPGREVFVGGRRGKVLWDGRPQHNFVTVIYDDDGSTSPATLAQEVVPVEDFEVGMPVHFPGTRAIGILEGKRWLVSFDDGSKGLVGEETFAPLGKDLEPGPSSGKVVASLQPVAQLAKGFEPDPSSSKMVAPSVPELVPSPLQASGTNTTQKQLPPLQLNAAAGKSRPELVPPPLKASLTNMAQQQRPPLQLSVGADKNELNAPLLAADLPTNRSEESDEESSCLSFFAKALLLLLVLFIAYLACPQQSQQQRPPVLPKAYPTTGGDLKGEGSSFSASSLVGFGALGVVAMAGFLYMNAQGPKMVNVSKIKSVRFQRGPTGLRIDAVSGKVISVATGSQGELLGLQEGGLVKMVNGRSYAPGVLNTDKDGVWHARGLFDFSSNYEVVIEEPGVAGNIF